MSTQTRRQFLGTLAATQAVRGSAAGRPNILVIITDQQRASMLSCAGNPYVKTPNLDSLAQAGARFERAYVANPVCSPSRTSLITGRMPSAIGMECNEDLRRPVKVPAAMLEPTSKMAPRRSEMLDASWSGFSKSMRFKRPPRQLWKQLGKA